MKLLKPAEYVSDDGHCKGSDKEVALYEEEQSKMKAFIDSLPKEWYTLYNGVMKKTVAKGYSTLTVSSEISKKELDFLVELGNLSRPTVSLLISLRDREEKKAKYEGIWYWYNMINGVLDMYLSAAKIVKS